MSEENRDIEAVILAAGRSLRMGQPKLALPWGNSTVLGHIISVLEENGSAFGLHRIVVVSGAAHPLIEQIIQSHPARDKLQICFNPSYDKEEMLFSLQLGLSCLSQQTQAALVVLGDQPQILPQTVHLLLQSFRQQPKPLIVPSYQMRRGHPWLIARSLWQAVMNLKPPQTLRDFFAEHAESIHYVNVNTPTILQDLDTPEDYERYRPLGKP